MSCAAKAMELSYAFDGKYNDLSVRFEGLDLEGLMGSLCGASKGLTLEGNEVLTL